MRARRWKNRLQSDLIASKPILGQECSFGSSHQRIGFVRASVFVVDVTTPKSLPARCYVQLSLGHGLIHGGEKGLVVKRFNEIGDRPSLYRRVPHRVVVVRRTYDDARLGRNDLELLLDFEATHT